jgi:hypothetical protein
MLIPLVFQSYVPDKNSGQTDRWTDGRTDKAATICSPFGEHKYIQHWIRWALAPIGRITVVKSLLLPLLTNLFMSLPKSLFSYVKGNK